MDMNSTRLPVPKDAQKKDNLNKVNPFKYLVPTKSQIGAGLLFTFIALTARTSGQTSSSPSIQSKSKNEIILNKLPGDYPKLLAQVDKSALAAKTGKQIDLAPQSNPAPGMAPDKNSMNAFPVIGDTIFKVGGTFDGILNDPKPETFNAAEKLNDLGLTAFPPNSSSIYIKGKKGEPPYFARFIIVMPGVNGVIQLDMISVVETNNSKHILNSELSSVKFKGIDKSLEKVGITSSSKLGQDYFVEMGYNAEEKTLFFDYKKDSKYVYSISINLLTMAITVEQPPNPSASGPLGQK